MNKETTKGQSLGQDIREKILKIIELLKNKKVKASIGIVLLTIMMLLNRTLAHTLITATKLIVSFNIAYNNFTYGL